MKYAEYKCLMHVYALCQITLLFLWLFWSERMLLNLLIFICIAKVDIHFLHVHSYTLNHNIQLMSFLSSIIIVLPLFHP